MREIHTFVLRIMVDTEEPQALRGALRPVATDIAYVFSDAQSLFDLLCQASNLAGEAAGGTSPLTSDEKNQ